MEFVVWLILLPFAGAFLLFAYGAGLIALEALSHWSVLTAGARWRLVAKLIGLACFIAPLLIMVALFVTHAAYGGSAEGGKLEQGRYFLGNHGNYVEVSRSTWNWVNWHETIAFRIGGPVCALGIAVMAILGRLERKRPNCSVNELIAVENPSESQTAVKAAAQHAQPGSRSYWIRVSLAALALMFVADTAAFSAFVVTGGNLVRCFYLIFILCLVSTACWAVSWLPWLRDKSILRWMLRAAGELGKTLWLAGPATLFLGLFPAALSQDVLLAAVLGILSLVVSGFQFVSAADAIALVAAAWAECFPKPKPD